MFKKLFGLENTFSLRRATTIIAALTLASRLVGLLRDRLLASKFGAGDTLDIYYASFRIPDLLYNLLILGTLSAAFIPIFSQYLLRNKQEANKLANTVLNASTLGIAFLCTIIFIFCEFFVHWLLPGFSGSKLVQTVMLTRLLLLSPIIFTISSLFSNVLISHKRFLVVNLAPVVYNFGIIAGIIFFYPRYGLPGLGVGVLLGAFGHLLIQIPELLRSGFSWQPILDIRTAAARKVGLLFLPRIFAFDASYVSLVIASVVGSVLASGSIAVFNLANNLSAVPLGIFALSTAVAAFPSLSEAYAEKSTERFTRILGKATIQILFFIIPISVLMFILRAHLVRVVLGSGNFNWQNTIDTFNTLGILTVSLFSQALVPLFSRAFYARHDTKIPVVASLLAMLLNAWLSYFFAKHFGVAGVSIGFTVSSVCNFVFLFILMQVKLGKGESEGSRVLATFDRLLFVYILKIVFASCIAGLVAYGARYALVPILNTHTGVGLLLQAGIAGLLGCSSYIVLTWKLGFEEARFLLSGLKKAAWWGSQKTT
jgi:putative peptidoglycan lipid II flippase